MKKNKLSIIIPTYNDGLYLIDAIKSALDIDNYWFEKEIVIINDGGSVHENVLECLNDSSIQFFTKLNGGVASARNMGIELCSGEFILPLDADNVLNAKEVPIFLSNLISSGADVIYGNCEVFGDKNLTWINKDIDYKEIVLNNHIDNCCIFRKSLWVKNNGYDVNIPNNTREDWVFWLSSIYNDAKFQYMDSVFFHYRYRGNSKVRRTTRLIIDKASLFNYIYPLQVKVLESLVKRNLLSKNDYKLVWIDLNKLGAYLNINSGLFRKGFKFLFIYMKLSYDIITFFKMSIFYPLRKFVNPIP